MSTFDIFLGVLLAVAVRDTIVYFVDRYESERRHKQLHLMLDQLEDLEADDED